MLLKAAWSWTLPQCLRRLPGHWWWWRKRWGRPPEDEEEEERAPQKEEGEVARERRAPADTAEGEEGEVARERRAPADTAEEGAPEPAEDLQICLNLSRHLFDLCVAGLLGLASPLFRLGLDVAGLRGPLRLWLHGLAAFLVTAGGLHLLLHLLHAHLLPFACLYGLLQALVLAVSVRGRRRGPPAEEEEEEEEYALAPETPPAEEEEEGGPR
ncbi:uncharacterized protein C6orf47 homolog [Rhinatrema bivittatum]|uniref:uncharacterized protein C6orf47 homolog n=1 Tax=Rhinatrema bivittatum TaxID=194408 RepID=UPI00112BFDD3|nr:uncharacterized protein C6orf47 homolog [Rhinatrema bivittatum]